MKKLELIKGLSYSMKGFSAVKGEPFSIEDEKADMIMKTGRFKEIETITPEDGDGNSEKPIEKMTKAELEELAEKNGVDISGCNNNKKRVAVIEEALENSADGEDDSDEINYDEMSDEGLAELAVKEEIDITACESREKIVETIKATIAGKAADNDAKAGFEE